jgi:large subunit ribosomal protein L5
MDYQPALQKRYKEEIVPALMKEFGYKSVMQVPRLKKIVLNRGVGEAVADKKLIESAQEELTLIAGQKAIKTFSKKAISNFKLREETPIGVKVTLRKAVMYEFLERLISVALPRVKDFNGVESNFDGKGNYSLGIEEQIIFPEINMDQVHKIIGLEASFVTSAPSDEEGFALLRAFGMPFKNLKKD